MGRLGGLETQPEMSGVDVQHMSTWSGVRSNEESILVLSFG